MLAPLLALALMQPTPEDLTTGTRLYHSCQEAKRMGDGANTVKNDRIAECLAYIGGYVDGSNLSEVKLFCVGNASMGTTIAVYLAFMDRNPKFLDNNRATGLLLALAETYPCPVKGK